MPSHPQTASSHSVANAVLGSYDRRRAGAADRAVFLLSAVPGEDPVLLRCLPARSICCWLVRPALVRPCRLLRRGGLRCGPRRKEWGLPFESAILLGMLAAGLFGAGFGYLSIRRQGLQFAMITLALAQLIYFLALQLPFTHAEDGLTGVPRGKVLGLFALDDNPVALLHRCRHLRARSVLHLSHHPLDLRAGPAVDPGQRAARDLARLRC